MAEIEMTEQERAALQHLIDLARHVDHALDDSEEVQEDGLRSHIIQAQDFDDVVEAIDALNDLPDDKPGVTMNPSDKAEWALRRILVRHIATAPAAVAGPSEWCAGVEAVTKMLSKKADDFALEHGHDDMGGLSFGSGAHAEAKMDWHSGLLELEEEARAMLGRVFPMTGDEEESDLGDWQDGAKKPTQDGTYLREFDEGLGTSEFHQGKWLRDGFFHSDIQDARWRGRSAPTAQPSPAAQEVK